MKLSIRRRSTRLSPPSEEDLAWLEALSFKTRLDNRPAIAVLLRLGFRAHGVIPLPSGDHALFRIDREAWARRRARLDAGGKDPFEISREAS